MLFRGLYNDALTLLEAFHPAANDLNETVQQMTIEAVSLSYLDQYPAAHDDLAKAAVLCAQADLSACGELPRAQGVIATNRGQLPEAKQFFLKSLEFARAHHDRELESSAWLNLSEVSRLGGQFDEAVNWSRDAYVASLQLGNENRAQIAEGNLGFAYFELGDSERALPLLLEAKQRAASVGNVRYQIKWLTDAGYVYQESGNFAQAIQPYRQSLGVAQKIDSKEDIVNTLEVLAHLSIETGKLDEADAYIRQLIPMVRATENRVDDLDVALAQGKIDAARGQDAQAEAIFRSVESDRDSQISMRLEAERDLAAVNERRGDLASADRMYMAALTTFEVARQQLSSESSKLPFLANAAPIYDDYIRLLLKQGQVQQALAVADHSRARTLAQGLGLVIPVQPAALDAARIARKANATLLFYWLGRSQSYLWAVTPTKTALYTLPARDQIAAIVQRYRNTLLGIDGSLEASSADGTELYRMLVAPAKSLLPAGSNVVVLSDDALSELNFETLIVPAATPHYWIEDATIISAPSLYMLSMAKPDGEPGRKLLLLGNAVTPDPDYPELPQAALEMQRIEKHFSAGDATVLAQLQANPESYLESNPQQYSYIHFVAHGIASLTDPLDSAIILSPASDAEDSFKLYARDIIQHHIHARLVTISSCYGGGTRSYAGEGLVGLSWAFLRAGAHNVIGALWEVSDDSTPQLMDTLYRRLEEGAPPSVALRQAKLALIHSQGSFRNPFYWAPFQIYTGL